MYRAYIVITPLEYILGMDETYNIAVSSAYIWIN